MVVLMSSVATLSPTADRQDRMARMGDWRMRLRARIAESGKTRSQVCSEAGLNPAYLTQILEQKGATPRIDNLAKIANVLDTTVCYLVDGIPVDHRASECLDLYGQLTDDRKAAALTILRDMASASQI